jgi:murein DD-endopeptidase MepM/ murein hydrolase activator NlpD
MIQLHHGIGILGFLGALLATPALSAAAEPGGGLVRLVEVARTRDGIAPEQLARIRAAVKAYEKRQGAAAAKDEAPIRYPFFPQAGIQGQDLFLNNFTDLDSRQGPIQDWDCSDYTYDGHQGHDSLIRSFREQAIGVPVFAALDGVVVDTHDGEPDMNTAADKANRANYVIIDHGGGYYGWYFHFRRGSVAVSPGQTVTAGTQIGLTGSSGFSDWPHLHFETRKNDVWVEPSAGPCHPGESLWEEQPPVDRDLYVADFFLVHGEIFLPDDTSFLFDDAKRTAIFVRGSQLVTLRLDLRNVPAHARYSLRVLNPRGQVAQEIAREFGNDSVYHLAYLIYLQALDLSLPGTWRLQVTMEDSELVDVPFQVVTTARQARNRPPNRIALRLSPRHAGDGQVVICQVQTSLITEDPDYDAVSYRYEWRVNGRLVRSVTSAALTDLLASGMAKPRDKVNCRVTPSDGKASGPTASAQAVLAP